jgi:hypothetical protein
VTIWTRDFAVEDEELPDSTGKSIPIMKKTRRQSDKPYIFEDLVGLEMRAESPHAKR